MYPYAGSAERKIKIVGGKEVCPDNKASFTLAIICTTKKDTKD